MSQRFRREYFGDNGGSLSGFSEANSLILECICRRYFLGDSEDTVSEIVETDCGENLSEIVKRDCGEHLSEIVERDGGENLSGIAVKDC